MNLKEREELIQRFSRPWSRVWRLVICPDCYYGDLVTINGWTKCPTCKGTGKVEVEDEGWKRNHAQHATEQDRYMYVLTVMVKAGKALYRMIHVIIKATDGSLVVSVARNKFTKKRRERGGGWVVNTVHLKNRDTRWSWWSIYANSVVALGIQNWRPSISRSISRRRLCASFCPSISRIVTCILPKDGRA